MGIFASFSAMFIGFPYKTWKSGLNGERAVIKNISNKLSHQYSIFNDVLLSDRKRMGNIDHIIVGPTGIFVIETKNNKHEVNFDGYKWIGISRNPITQVENNAFRVKDVLKQCHVFGEKEPYVNAILLFSNSRVKLTIDEESKLRFSKIIRIKNQSDSSLADYILNKSNVFSSYEVSSIEQFLKTKISNYDEQL